ncbi:MAG: response regulator transcription factor [Bordetella sp.]|nr:response regulator transcription factor [Bordetella sp.]
MVLDIGLPDQGALELVSRLRRVAPEVAILIFSGHAELDYAGLLVREGARAYLHKSCDPADLVRAIRVLARGGRYITPAVADAMARQITREAGMAPHLSRREFQLFLKLAQGMTISQAADALCLSVKTATSYRTRLMAKMAMHSNHQLTYHALESELNTIRAKCS